MNHNRHITLDNSNIIVKYTNERIIPASGLAVVGALLGKSNFTKKLNHIDVTPMDNSKTAKQGVSRTYKGFDGYSPMMAYIGTEGYAVNFELREGKQHCQNGTVEFLLETISLCKKLTDKPLLVRLDSGNDSIDNVAVLIDTGCSFIIKRNLRKENKEEWFQMAKTYCKDITTPREGKTVYIGSGWKEVTSKRFDKDFTLRAGYEITERTIDKKGQFLLPADIEVETWWTNLGKSDHEIIKLYHGHGECEQYHSGVKSGMDVERLPSGKFETNALVLELTVIAYNILRMIGQGTIGKRTPRQKRAVKRRRLRTVMSDLIMMASHITSHSMQLIMGLGKSNVWWHIFADFCRDNIAINA